MADLSAGEIERLNTWAGEIASSLLPAETRWHDEGSERRFHRTGLSINQRRGCWYSHTAKRGGHSALGLIAFLRANGPADALQYAIGWLAGHVGVGGCTHTEETDDGPASKDDARDVIDRLVDPANTIAEAYWRSRKIEPPFPDCVRFLENARVGESAAVGILTARGRIVGVELTYLDPTGRKSTVSPQKRTFKIEKAPDAVFDIPSRGENGDVVVCEGLPDLLSVYRWGARRCRHIGLPGIGTLARLHFAKGTKTLVVAQGDASGSPAAKALEHGLDRLLLDGCDVNVTAIPPAGMDVNDILMQAGVDGVRTLLDSTQPANLSLDGEIERLSRLDELAYERVRLLEAKRLDIRVGVLDDAVRKRRGAPPPSEDDWTGVSDDPVEHDPIDLADTLDGIIKELGRYIVAPETALATLALWAAHTHLVHHQVIYLPVSPRLGIQARDYGCGKTVTLEAVGCLVANPKAAASITASPLFRSIERNKPTLMLDEVHLLFQGGRNPELLAMMNASHRRSQATILRSRTLPNGDWEDQEFNVWATMALATVGDLPRDQSERSIFVNLDKALGEDVKEHLENGSSVELTTLKAKLLIWAGDLEELPRPTMPEILLKQHGRVGDNWRPLLAIAELAGGRWPKLALDAALAAISAERPLSLIQRLLLGIRKAFDRFSLKMPSDTIETGELLATLIRDPDEEWDRANRGVAINAYWLRGQLRGLLHPAGAKDWWVGREHKSGYYRDQFTAAWRAHLAGFSEYTPSHPFRTSGASGVSGYPFDNIDEFQTPSGEASGVSGVAPDAPDHAPDQNSNSPTKSTTSLDAPDTPDIPEEHVGAYGLKRGSLPNGEDETPKKRRLRGTYAADIRAYAAAHPDLDSQKLAKRFGCSRVRVERILGVES